MTISSETEEHRFSGDGRETVYVTLSLTGFGNNGTEVYDPFVDPVSTGIPGKQRVDGEEVELSVVGTENVTSGVVYDTFNREITDLGGSAPTSLDVTLKIVANPSP
jgi:hypothetical protein